MAEVSGRGVAVIEKTGLWGLSLPAATRSGLDAPTRRREVSDLEVHPVAALFPMLADDELAELADDIRERGLLQPVVLDPDGRVLDGRNRLAACELAGVEPAFTLYEGDDPDGYALSVNIARRHLSTGARAVIAAKAARRNGTSSRTAAEAAQICASQRVRDANVVLDWAPDLAPAIVAGAYPLSRALDEARSRKVKAEALAAKMDRLRSEAPDLAPLVDEERMALDDAIAALEARIERARLDAEEEEREAEARRSEEERVRREQEAVERAHAARVSDTFRSCVGRINATFHTDELRAQLVEIYRDDLGDAMPDPINPETIRAAGDHLHAIATLWEERQ